MNKIQLVGQAITSTNYTTSRLFNFNPGPVRETAENFLASGVNEIEIPEGVLDPEGRGENGSLPPVFDFDEDHTFFLCRLPVHPQATMPEALMEQVTPETEAPVTAPVTAPVSEYVERLLRLLDAKGPHGNAEIRLAFGLKNRRRLRETYIGPALSGGLIEYTIPDKPNSRLQKYRLTDKGRAWLKQAQQ